MSNQQFGDGTICAEIAFDTVEPESLCGLLLYRNPRDESIIEVQLGGAVGFCSLLSFGGGQWNILARAGVGPPEAKRKYQIEVTVSGSSVNVTVDGINVLSATLPAPLPRGQAGIFCQSKGDIEVSNFVVQGRPFRAFVVMQFSEAYNALYREVVMPVCELEGVQAIRADEVYGPGLIIQDIERQLIEAQIVIAEISPTNANVYYEVGYAHALKKQTILIADTTSKLPFDVSGFRTLFYENSIAGKGKVEAGLRKHLAEILKSAQGP
jgi:hypothetical protein